ncbi:MAG: hypothetical protein HFH82_03755 [Lachnospiraceae bacterium]|nr:hypothetical protein [Lachnospiraceae bacterium]
MKYLKILNQRLLQSFWFYIVYILFFRSALQNPSDPDAAYRNKSGKLYRGYIANMEETVGKNGSVVTDYQFDKNIHTDSHFLQEALSQMEKSEEEIILVVVYFKYR